MIELARVVLRAHDRACRAIRAVLDAVQERRVPTLLPVRRAFQALAELPDDARGLVLALPHLDSRQDDLSVRLALVGVLALQMARRAGLGTGASRDVAVAAGLAGAGRVLHMGSEHAAPDAPAATSSFVGGARALLAGSGPGRVASLCVAAAADQSSAARRRHGHTLGRVTAVVNAYQRLTSPPPIGSGYTSLRALSGMIARDDLDPEQVALLADTLGLYAPGSVVVLDTGETAVVRDAPASQAVQTRPPVVIVSDATGAAATPLAVDLAETSSTIVGFSQSAALNVAAALVQV